MTMIAESITITITPLPPQYRFIELRQ